MYATIFRFLTLLAAIAIVQAHPLSPPLLRLPHDLSTEATDSASILLPPDHSHKLSPRAESYDYEIPYSQITLSFSQFSKTPLNTAAAARLLRNSGRIMLNACMNGHGYDPIKSPSSREEQGIEILVETLPGKRSIITKEMLWQILTGVAHFFIEEEHSVFWGVRFDVEVDGRVVGKGRLWDTGGGSIMSDDSTPPESPVSSIDSGGSSLGSSGGSSGSIGSE